MFLHQGTGKLLAAPGKQIDPFFGHCGKVGGVVCDLGCRHEIGRRKGELRIVLPQVGR
jgi:hypothetical protein